MPMESLTGRCARGWRGSERGRDATAVDLHRRLQWAGKIVRRLPFTLVSLAGLSLVAVLTNSRLGDLPRQWFSRLAFAPRDLWLIHWERLITSALVTNGGRAFWQALGMVALTAGAAEWLAGTRRAALTFWGVHLATLLVYSLLIVVPLHALGSSLGTALYLARDVGPSAGGFGCLGLACARLPQPWRWIGGGAIVGGLAVALFLAASTTQSAVVISADLAHLLAFPLGWLSSLIGRRHGVPARRTSGPLYADPVERGANKSSQ
jgi:hypothetical protein